MGVVRYLWIWRELCKRNLYWIWLNKISICKSLLSSSQLAYIVKKLSETQLTCRTYDINVKSHYYTVQAFLPEMIKTGIGHIVVRSLPLSLLMLLTDPLSSSSRPSPLQQVIIKPLTESLVRLFPFLPPFPFPYWTSLFALLARLFIQSGSSIIPRRSNRRTPTCLPPSFGSEENQNFDRLSCSYQN